jgi:hypothetical protein
LRFRGALLPDSVRFAVAVGVALDLVGFLTARGEVFLLVGLFRSLDWIIDVPGWLPWWNATGGWLGEHEV